MLRQCAHLLQKSSGSLINWGTIDANFRRKTRKTPPPNKNIKKPDEAAYRKSSKMVDDKLEKLIKYNEKREEIKIAKRKKRKKKKVMVPRKPLTPEEETEKSYLEAGKMLTRIPQGWHQESSVIKEALGMQEEIPLQITDGQEDVNKSITPFVGDKFDFDICINDLESRISKLESNSIAIRKRHNHMTPRLKSSQAYLDVLYKCPTGMEAAMWLDELEALVPEWLTSQHYELAILLMTEFGSPVSERDILIVWLKARSKKLLSPVACAAIVRGLGIHSLREVIFPIIYKAILVDYGEGNIPAEVSEALFYNLRQRRDVDRLLQIYMTLSSAGTHITISGYMDIIGSLSECKQFRDQDVLNFLVEELQLSAQRVIEEEGMVGIPKNFFSRALTAASPNTALRLWSFMSKYGIRVSYNDYRSLIRVMSKNNRVSEARQVYQYLAKNNPDYLWFHNCSIPKSYLKCLTGTPAEALYVFSVHFGPDSNTKPSRSAYMSLIKCQDDPHFVHEIWKEMLARGLELNTKHYNLILKGMGGDITKLPNVPYSIPASPLDDEIPESMKSLATDIRESEIVRPPPSSLTNFNPYEQSPLSERARNVFVPSSDPSWKPGRISSDSITTGPFTVREQYTPQHIISDRKTLSPDEYISIQTDLERKHASKALLSQQEQKFGIHDEQLPP